MGVSRDPSKIPEVPSGILKTARDLGMQVMSVCCVGSEGSVQFFSMAPGIPRVGDFIEIDDGTWFRVIDVVWKTTRLRDEISLVANVFSEGHSPPDSEDAP